MLGSLTWALRRQDMVEEDEERLLARVRSDPDAFAELYVRHMPAVYRYLLACTGNVDDAADLTQQSFAKAYASLGRYRGSGSFLAWVLRIARNAAVDANRRRRPSLSWEGLPEWQLPASAESVEGTALREETFEALRALVAGLSDEKRDLIALRYGAALSCEEIGRVLRISEGAARKRLQRVLRELGAACHGR